MRALVNFIFWFIYYPLVKILVAALKFNPKVRERIDFEDKNKRQTLCKSFKEQNTQADLCFEFSSEGEYQQIASLVSDALKAGKKLELVFFSPSVEKAIENLAAQYPQQIRFLRYRLLTLSLRDNFSSWVSANELVMVRYDFFPEFLLWALEPQRVLHLLWVSLKKERLKNKSPGLYKRMFLKSATQLFFASEEDRVFGELYGFTGPQYDFRIEQIRRRMLLKNETFQKNFPFYQELKSALNRFPRHKRLLFGNAWPSDLFLLEHLPTDVFILLVPHKLSPDIIEAFTSTTKGHRKDVMVYQDAASLETPGATVILNKKGVLCELYSDFGFAYVGGGFETSVHSLLEPLVSGSDKLSCGPLHLRSSEYDLAHGLNVMTEVNAPEEFLAWLESTSPSGSGLDKLEEVFKLYSTFRDKIIPC